LWNFRSRMFVRINILRISRRISSSSDKLLVIIWPRYAWPTFLKSGTRYLGEVDTIHQFEADPTVLYRHIDLGVTWHFEIQLTWNFFNSLSNLVGNFFFQLTSKFRDSLFDLGLNGKIVLSHSKRKQVHAIAIMTPSITT